MILGGATTALGGCITLPVGTAINRSVETCGLFIFVGTHASISVPPWNLNVIRPSLWTVTVSTCVSLSKLISISSSIIGSLNLMDLSH